MRVRRDRHQAALLAAAARMGIEAEDLAPTWGVDDVIYRADGREALVGKGRIFPWMRTNSEFICDHKHVCKAFLRALGVRVPPGILLDDLDDPEQRAAVAAQAARGPQVLKPADAAHGDGVHVGLSGEAEIAAAWQAERGRYDAFILEDRVPGHDLRVQVVGGRLVAACVREPAAVTGDGARTLGALIEARRAEMAAQNPQNKLVIDEDSRALLARQGLGLDDVPEAGRSVRLKSVNNLAVGGRAVDVTDRLHPRWATWVERASAELGMRALALDAMTPDPGLDPVDHAHVLEINARADWLHHTFSERRTHDIPGLLLRDLLRLG